MKSENIEDAIKKVKTNCTTKFNESIDVSFRLNLKKKKEEISLRTNVNLPNEAVDVIEPLILPVVVIVLAFTLALIPEGFTLYLTVNVVFAGTIP